MSFDNENKSYNRYNNDGEQRPHRPRVGSYNREGGERPYRSSYNNRGANGERPQRPRFNPNREGGFNREGGYSTDRPQRPRFQGGQQPRNARPQRPRTAGYNPNAKYSMKKQIEYKDILTDPNEPIRLNKFLANAGVCSRREADEFIQAGVVRVNGEVVTELGTKVQRTDTVHFHDQLISIEKKVYVLLNKPKDYVTTSDDPQQRKTVMDLVKNCCRERIYPVGRLDRNTMGVLLFTNDGDLASKLTHPKFNKKKIYQVTLDKDLQDEDFAKILNEEVQKFDRN